MSVNSLSGVSFKANGVMRHDDPLSRESLGSAGAFTTEQLSQPGIEPGHKKHSFIGSVAKLVLKLAVLVGAAVAARKYIPALGKEKISTEFIKDIAAKIENKEKVGFGNKAKYYFAKYTDAICEKFVKIFNKTPKPTEDKAPGVNTQA